MIDKEFDLSEKIKFIKNKEDTYSFKEYDGSCPNQEEVLSTLNVKEFIRRLKEELTPPINVNVEEMQVGEKVTDFIIDKLAGYKLT